MRLENSKMRTINWNDDQGGFEMIDQRIIDRKFLFVSYNAYRYVVETISSLVVQGASCYY
jgi:methylthioribose-1-phosphate isomerase